ncbi:unnamed protein product [Protopolystoma xenopodis]|uniref:Uncharacterized protein n=1 Tax=Protopolystoma xenopodis TaxID=117903 RepID=A0A448WCB1_9PLAT|nr:unnamed protein product [Protopolystoma xenopodis]
MDSCSNDVCHGCPILLCSSTFRRPNTSRKASGNPFLFLSLSLSPCFHSSFLCFLFSAHCSHTCTLAIDTRTPKFLGANRCVSGKAFHLASSLERWPDKLRPTPVATAAKLTEETGQTNRVSVSLVSTHPADRGVSGRGGATVADGYISRLTLPGIRIVVEAYQFLAGPTAILPNFFLQHPFTEVSASPRCLKG